MYSMPIILSACGSILRSCLRSLASQKGQVLLLGRSRCLACDLSPHLGTQLNCYYRIERNVGLKASRGVAPVR